MSLLWFNYLGCIMVSVNKSSYFYLQWSKNSSHIIRLWKFYIHFQKYNYIIKSSIRLCLPLEIVAAPMGISQTKVLIILGQRGQLKISSLSYCYLHLHLGPPGKRLIPLCCMFTIKEKPAKSWTLLFCTFWQYLFSMVHLPRHMEALIPLCKETPFHHLFYEVNLG